MMKYTADEFNRAKSKMAGDINAAITDREDQLKAGAAASGEELAAAPGKFEEQPGSAREKLAAASRQAIRKARETAATTDHYVHASPWTAIGIAAAAGVLIGFLAARR